MPHYHLSMGIMLGFVLATLAATIEFALVPPVGGE
jgi:hypothetical protein